MCSRLRELHWLPIERRIRFKLLLYVYKTLSFSEPVYLHELLTSYSPGRQGLRSSSQSLLKEHVAKNKWGSRSFVFVAAKLWNNLPLSIRSATSLNIFKEKLKTHLFLDF